MELIKKILLFFVSLFCGHYLFSQNTEVTDIAKLPLADLMNIEVTVASMSSENVMEAPSIVSIITKEEINRFAEVNLGEILNRLVSTSFISANVLTKNIVDFRGQSFTPYNNHTLFLLNGRPVRDPITGGLNSALLTAFPVKLIEKIEIIRGPGSVLYGSCAFSGVVNIITRAPVNQQVTASGRIESGNLGYFNYSAYTTLQKDDVSATFGFKSYRHNGELFEFTDYNSVDSSANFWEKGYGLMGTINYKNYHFSAGLFDYRPYSLGGTENAWSMEWGDKEEHLAYFTNMGYEAEIGENGIVSVDFTRNQHTWHTDLGKIMFANDIMGEINYRFKLQEINILTGGTYGGTTHESDYFNDGTNYYGSMYFQADYWINNKIKVIGGLQYNNIRNKQHSLSPRAGIILKSSKNLGLKLLYGQAFRKGYPLETSFIIPQLLGNENLRPEIINTLETELFYHQSNFKISTSIYYSYVHNIVYRIPYNDLGYYKYDNGPTHQFWGVEADMKYRMTNNLFFIASTNYQQNKSDEGIMNATLHPNLMVKGGVIYSLGGFNAGIYNSFFSAPSEVKKVNPDVRVVNPEAKPYNLLSAKFSYQFTTGNNTKNSIEAFIKGQNLLNLDIRYPEFTSKGVNTLIPLRTSYTIRAGVMVNLN